MSYLSSTTTIARIALFAAVLLAVMFLASQSFFPAFAQEGPKMVNEGEKHVATFAATDEDGDDITWSIDPNSTDALYFEISENGVLTFVNTPDYEVPVDDDTDNEYTVTVKATDNGDPEEEATETLTVMVVNLPEPGVIDFSSLQPKEGTAFIVTTFTDPDLQRSADGTTVLTGDTDLLDDTNNVNWQWARCSTMEDSTCLDIEENSTSTSYTPVEADPGHYLRVTATYADGHTPTPATGEEIELDKTASAMSANMVARADYVPVPPLFPGQNPAISQVNNVDTRATAATTSRDVAENSRAGTNVGAPVTATDEGADGNPETLTYTLQTSLVAASYTINSVTGQISVAAGATLDHETNEAVTVTVRATDPTDRYSEVDVAINITDVDENPTVSGIASYPELTENSHEDAPVLTLGTGYAVSDPEDGDTATNFTWSISGRDGARFAISAGGQLSFKEAPNYERPWRSGGSLAQRNIYNLTVEATDTGGNTGTLDVVVVVRNAQEAGTITLSNRGARVGTSLTATLNEPDGVSGTVTWTWAGNGTTTVRTGGTSNTYSPHSGFAGGSLTITAAYDDVIAAEQEAVLATTATTMPNTTAATTPVWQNTGGDRVTSVSTSLNENLTVATAVSHGATASDPGGDSILSYSLSGSDSSAFTIVETTGALSTNAAHAFDHERKSSYNVRISVKNRANRSANLSVRVNVNDLDESPVFTSGATTTDYAEGSSALRVGGTRNAYVARDPEGEIVTLELGGADAAAFNLQNGVLSFKVAPDYEDEIDADSGNDYVITITASDSTADDVVQNVTVNVTDIDEDGVVSLDALAPKNSVQLQAELTDPDGTIASQQWTWSNSSSLNGPWATSTGTGATSTSGESIANYTPNGDDVGYYLRASVIYTDGESVSRGDTPLATKTAAIVSTNVVSRTDYLNTAPIFPGQEPEGDDTPNQNRTPNATTSREIAENSPAGTNVGAPVVAEDLDENLQQQVLTYTMADADVTGDAANFVIGRGTGQITLANNVMLNHETKDAYVVTVTATDPTGLMSSSEVTIMVTDVKEPPVIPMVSTTANFNLAATSSPEDAGITAVISTYQGTDDEDNAKSPREEVEWTLDGADKELFRLCRDANDFDSTCIEAEGATSSASVVLTFKDPVNFEDPSDSGRNNVYDVTVIATDNDDMTAMRRVVVRVTNVHEDGTVALSNRQPEVGVRITASLGNPDGSVGNVSWKWEQCGNPTCAGTPDPITGATSATYIPTDQNIVDGTGQWLRATVTYTDNAMGEDDPNGDVTANVDESKSDTALMISAFGVQAKPTANATPQFADEDQSVGGKQAVRYIRENSTTDRDVVSDEEGVNTGTDPDPDPVTATDGDTGDELTYTLSGRDQSSFEIDWGTGQITLKEGTELNYETKRSYSVIVTATDSSLARDSITVTINVVDVNEAPVIMERGVSVSGLADVSYAEDRTGAVQTYRATGPDAVGATLSLSGADEGAFSLSGGILSFNSQPDFESAADANTDNVYNITVTAIMGSFSHALDVTVTVTNADEDGTVELTYDQGQVRVGVAITAEEPVDPDGGVTNVSWRWESSSDGSTGWSDIAGATTAAYTPVDGDVGNFLRATASYTDAHGPGKSASSEATPTAVAPEAAAGTDGTVSLSPTSGLVSGDSVTATLTDADNPIGLTWVWQTSANGSTNWSAGAGSDSSTGLTSTYTTTNADGGEYLRATVTYADDSGAGQTAESPATTGRVAIDSYDRNSDGRIDAPEVLAAVADYFGGTIDGSRVLDVVALYFSGLN